MDDKFKKLNPEKQQRILQAAYEEFIEQSYDNASTNQIVKKAGISKGALFNYFSSKEELYYYIINDGFNFIQERNLKTFATRDFIERCKILAEVDIKIYAEAPHITEFFAKLYLNESSKLPEGVADKMAEILNDTFMKLYDNVDSSLFRDDLPAEVIMKMIRWTLDGYRNNLVEKLKNEKILSDNLMLHIEEYNQFIITLKKVFYKKGV